MPIPPQRVAIEARLCAWAGRARSCGGQPGAARLAPSAERSRRWRAAHGQIGALMAESFCERILSCAKQVVHSARLSYKAEEYSMVVILRMNRAFHGVHAQAREGL